MNGRWSWWGPLLIHWSRWVLLLRVEIRWGGVWRRKGFLMENPFMVHWADQAYYFSLEEYLGCEGSMSCVIFCLVSCMGEGSHNKPFEEKGLLHYYGLVLLCKCNGESVDRLFLHCGEVFRLWSFALRSFGVSWVLPKRVIDLLASWRNWLGKHSSYVWNLVPHCVMWIIWRERNNRIFEDLVLSGDKLLELFATTFFDWSRAWGFTSSKSILLFLDSLFSCT